MKTFFFAFILFFFTTNTFAVSIDTDIVIVGFVNIDTLYRYYNPNYHKNPNKVKNQYDSPCERFITYMKKKEDTANISFPMDIFDSSACILFCHIVFARFFLYDKINNDTIKDVLKKSYNGENNFDCWLSKKKKKKKQRYKELVFNPTTFLQIRMTVNTWNEFGSNLSPKYVLFYKEREYANDYINVLVPIVLPQ